MSQPHCHLSIGCDGEQHVPNLTECLISITITQLAYTFNLQVGDA